MKLSTKKKWIGLLFIAPFLLGFFIFYLIPFIWSIFYSFTIGAGGTQFAGLQNYFALFQSTAFQLAAFNTFRFIGIGVPSLMGFSFLLALLLYQPLKGFSFFRAVFLCPLVLPAASVITIVRALFSDDGLMNQFCSLLRLPVRHWLNSEYAFPILIGLYIWKNCGYNLVLFLAGLAAVPKECLEAADCEGASPIQKLRYIFIPLLIPSFFFIFIISLINSFKSFREAFLLGGATPHRSIYMLQHFMNNNFQNLNYQRLSAAALLIFGVIFVLVLLLFWWKKKNETIA